MSMSEDWKAMTAKAEVATEFLLGVAPKQPSLPGTGVALQLSSDGKMYILPPKVALMLLVKLTEAMEEIAKGTVTFDGVVRDIQDQADQN